MTSSRRGVLIALLTAWSVSYSSGDVPASPWPAQPMPPDRADDSYAIYSQLLPLGETANWPAKFYAVESVTITAVPADAPCMVPAAKTGDGELLGGSGMNPHVALAPPSSNRQDYEQLLSDFDAHCHDRLELSADPWNAKLPVHMLNQADQEEFRRTRLPSHSEAERNQGSPALYAFSQVYFNTHHTVAMVYSTHWCGSLCGQGFWIVLGKENGAWKCLPWPAANWIS